MFSLCRLWQRSLCVFGVHQAAPPRDPPGPVATYCALCGKGLYCHGMAYSALNIYPSLVLPNFPRVLGPVSSFCYVGSEEPLRQ